MQLSIATKDGTVAEGLVVDQSGGWTETSRLFRKNQARRYFVETGLYSDVEYGCQHQLRLSRFRCSDRSGLVCQTLGLPPPGRPRTLRAARRF